MKLYLVSLGAGVLVGVIYSVLNVRSPAPPLVAPAALHIAVCAGLVPIIGVTMPLIVW